MANRLYNKQISPKGYKAGGSVKEEPMRDRMKQPLKRKGGSLKAVDDKKRKSKKIEANKAEYKKLAKDISPEVSMYLKHGKDFPGFDKARRIRGGLKKGGSALKPVQPNQKGLSKLPTEVRNKMGYMKKGGVVSDTKKKQFKENKAGQKSFNKKAIKVAKTIGKIVNPAAGAADVGVKLAKKFKGGN